MAFGVPPGVTPLAVLHPHALTPAGCTGRGAHVVLAGKFIFPRSLDENPIFPSKPINNEESAFLAALI
jgi:hypothetical protein